MSETWRTSGLLRSTSGARAAIATALGLVSLGLAAGEAAAQTKREVNFGLPVAAINSSYCMFPTAMRLGFFAAEGLEVKIQNIAGSTSVVQTVLSGRLDVGGATPEPIFKSYSQGERAGYVQKFSKKGWICKTWEGELAMVSIPGTMPEKFYFTVRGDAVAARINVTLGQRVALTYAQHKGVPTSCFGETEYFVQDVRIVE